MKKTDEPNNLDIVLEALASEHRREILYALELRSLYECVIAGYHMNKKHWNTVTVEKSDVDEETAKELIDHSYELVYKSLTKKKREALR